MGFRVSVSLHPAIQATGRLTFAPAGLIPAEHTSLHWTHKRTQSTRTAGAPGVRLRERTQRRSGCWCRAVGYRSRISAIEGAGIQFIDEMAEG
jgi:hypothetical protein